MEIYKDVIGYEGIYQVSNLGNIKSFKFCKEKYKKLCKDKDGYLSTILSKDGVRKSVKAHQLVAESFLNHKRCGMRLVVNYIDFDKTNNKLDNLEITTQRENANLKHLKSSSVYTGVSWDKLCKKWRSQILINGKINHLGYFTEELKASESYQKALSNL